MSVDFVQRGEVRFFSALEPLFVPIDSVVPADYNYNNGDLEEIQASIEDNGMFEVIKVRRATGEIIAGSHTWMVCKMMGSDVAPVVHYDVSEVEAKKMMVAHNETAKRARPDKGLLLALLDEITEETGDLRGTSVSEAEHKALRALEEAPLVLDETSQWPTFSVRVPPNVLHDFMRLTEQADTDRGRFEMMMRMAGWKK